MSRVAPEKAWRMQVVQITKCEVLAGLMLARYIRLLERSWDASLSHRSFLAVQPAGASFRVRRLQRSVVLVGFVFALG